MALSAALFPGVAHGQAQQTPIPEQPSRILLAVGDRFAISGDGRQVDSALPTLLCPEPQLLTQV